MRIESSVTAISWIPSEAISGMPKLPFQIGIGHYDEPPPDQLAEGDLEAAIRLIEDYHPLDVECAATSVCLLRGVRERYPELTYLLDGDGGDENLKSYPLEDSDLTLSSILRNPLLYQEGWGVDAIKHSLAYSGGLSRGYVRTYAPAAVFGFDAFSPYTTRSVIAAAVAIPFEQILAGRGADVELARRELILIVLVVRAEDPVESAFVRRDQVQFLRIDLLVHGIAEDAVADARTVQIGAILRAALLITGHRSQRRAVVELVVDLEHGPSEPVERVNVRALD